MQIPPRMLNSRLTTSTGREVVLLEWLPVSAGETIRIEFEGESTRRRHGIWIATVGHLRIDGHEYDQFVIWTDTAPRVVEIACDKTDGHIRLYNVWDTRDTDRGWHLSQSDESGMVVTELAERDWRYSCNDLGFPPTFDDLVFRLAIA